MCVCVFIQGIFISTFTPAPELLATLITTPCKTAHAGPAGCPEEKGQYCSGPTVQEL